ncbi:class I SAM-dependent methyltransferase [Streptomyces sp. NPDC017949]|uniref:class I SAM-dependent methyltransferase n=1 Tax=Streptomyces sp. NPDC017949 TaxID=3365020 RepID=UPI0037AE67EF
MAPHDAVLGWDEDTTAEAYAAYCRDFPLYGATSRDLARRAHLADSRLAIDLCGGAGATAEEILALVPPHCRVISLDSSAAMQRVGRRTLIDPRLAWITAPAEELALVAPAGGVDALVCNSAIWKTDVPRVFTAVARVLRPGGLFVFNIGGGFAGVRHADEDDVHPGPSLNRLIHQVAARDHGHTPAAAATPPKLPLEKVCAHLAAVGLDLVESEVVAQHGTMAEKRAWLSIPVFARPEGDFTHAQRMTILAKAYALTTPEATTVSSWLTVVARQPA